MGGAQLDDRQVSGEALLKHPEVDAHVHLGRLVLHEPGLVVDHLLYLEGGRGHGWTEGVVGHGYGYGHVLGAGVPVCRSSGGQLDGLLVPLDGLFYSLIWSVLAGAAGGVSLWRLTLAEPSYL